MNRNKSFIKTLKRNGPNTEPLGTTLANSFQEQNGDSRFLLVV